MLGDLRTGVLLQVTDQHASLPIHDLHSPECACRVTNRPVASDNPTESHGRPLVSRVAVEDTHGRHHEAGCLPFPPHAKCPPNKPLTQGPRTPSRLLSIGRVSQLDSTCMSRHRRQSHEAMVGLCPIDYGLLIPRHQPSGRAGWRKTTVPKPSPRPRLSLLHYLPNGKGRPACPAADAGGCGEPSPSLSSEMP